MYRSVLDAKDFIRWSQEALVALVAHNEKGHEEQEGFDSYGSPVKRCSLYPGLACNDHVDAAVDIDTPRDDDLIQVPFLELHPNTWLVSPTGEVTQVAEAEQFVPAKIRERVEALQKALGAPVPLKGYAPLKEAAAQADTARDEGRRRDALTQLATLGRALKEPHAALKDFINARLTSIDADVTLDFEDARDSARLTAADKRAKIAKLLETVDVAVLGARPPCHAMLKAWLEAK